MSGPRIRDMSPRALRILAAKPMTPWELRDARKVPVPRAELRPNERWLPDCYVNSRYSVQISLVATAYGDVTHLWIRAHDGSMPRSWRDLQRIKDELVGPERVAVEVFPPESELGDSANMAHLWVYPTGHVLPFRLHP
jgi:hypothetical protein